MRGIHRAKIVIHRWINFFVVQFNAEGVEDKLQLTYLQKLKCDDIQGFLFARPMPSSQFETLL